jgi:hypothetical protein
MVIKAVHFCSLFFREKKKRERRTCVNKWIIFGAPALHPGSEGPTFSAPAPALIAPPQAFGSHSNQGFPASAMTVNTTSQFTYVRVDYRFIMEIKLNSLQSTTTT